MRKRLFFLVGIIILLYTSITIYSFYRISLLENSINKALEQGEELKSKSESTTECFINIQNKLEGISNSINEVEQKKENYSIDERYISPSSTEVIIDRRLELSLIDVIFKHFEAYEKNNKTLFLETIYYSQPSQWDEDFESFKNRKYIIKKIVPESGRDRLNPNGYYWVHVLMDDGGEYFPFVLGVAKEKGKWGIYGYD
ncbi:MAG: hypothetical protein ACOYWZ_11925 [Bacillota bacterium]